MNVIKPSVILFDVNETLLDMAPLKKKINHLLGSSKGFRIWFGMLLQYSLVENCTNQYHDFSTIANATLDMAGKAMKKAIDENGKKTALAKMKELKAYPDVEKGLKLLKQNGFRLATLSNSAEGILKQQLAFSNLSSYFELTLSVDTIKKYKPDLQTYTWAAEQLKVDPAAIIMVAAQVGILQVLFKLVYKLLLLKERANRYIHYRQNRIFWVRTYLKLQLL